MKKLLTTAAIAAMFLVTACESAPRPEPIYVHDNDDNVIVNNYNNGGDQKCTMDEQCAPGTCNKVSGMCVGESGANGTSCMVEMDENACAVIKCGEFNSDPICNGQDAPTGQECETNEQCDDSNWCSFDFCDQASGTCHVFLPTFCEPYEEPTCDDGDACTVDAFVDGRCAIGGYVSCDDGNLWTQDSCDASLGCLHDPIIPEPFQCYGLRFQMPAGASCVGYPAPVPGAVEWTTAEATPDADGFYTAPTGICSVLCTAKPLSCEGQWDGVEVNPWTSVGCDHLVWPNGTTTDKSGCTFDGQSCQIL